jgi:hypothetical protein
MPKSISKHWGRIMNIWNAHIMWHRYKQSLRLITSAGNLMCSMSVHYIIQKNFKHPRMHKEFFFRQL